MNVSRNAVTVVAAVLCTIVTISAQFAPQNARLNGLGGTFIMDDMNDILRYAAYMDQYKDGGQATLNIDRYSDSTQAALYGSIIGVKAIGDALSVGIVANRGLLLDQSTVYGFYSTGAQALTAGITPLSGSGLAAQNVPHLLLGINLSAVTIGIDAFYEYASAKVHSETTGATPTENDASVRIHNPGAIASVRLGGEEMPITAKVGFGLPKIHGLSDDGTTEVTVESDQGRFFTVGGEAGLPAGDFRFTVGLDYNFEGYAFSTNDATPVREYHNNRLAHYVGLQGDMFTAAKWGAQYTMYVLNANLTTTTDTTKNRELRQAISCGIENGWQNVWIFDEAFARGGLSFVTSTPISYSRIGTTSARGRLQTTYFPVVPTIGAGVKKTIFQFDVTLNPTAWTGLVAGPAVGTVTLSLMF